VFFWDKPKLKAGLHLILLTLLSFPFLLLLADRCFCYPFFVLLFSNQHLATLLEMAEIRRKLVIVGDGACGKTCLLMYVAYLFFPPNLTPVSKHLFR